MSSMLPYLPRDQKPIFLNYLLENRKSLPSPGDPTQIHVDLFIGEDRLHCRFLRTPHCARYLAIELVLMKLTINKDHYYVNINNINLIKNNFMLCYIT